MVRSCGFHNNILRGATITCQESYHRGNLSGPTLLDFANIEIVKLRSWKSWYLDAPEPEILKSQRSGAGNFEIRCPKQRNRNPETEIPARGRRNVAAATLNYLLILLVQCSDPERVCSVRPGVRLKGSCSFLSYLYDK